VASKQAELFRNRIIGYGTKAADQFEANPLNYRKHPQRQRDAVQASLRELGWIGVVVENKRTGRLIDGHERVWQALQQNEDVPYIEVDLTEDEERLALAVFDPITNMAETDAAILDDLLREVNTGEAALQALLGELAEGAGLYGEKPTGDTEPQIDRAEELRAKWNTAPGQLWQLDEHKLICGDCTDPATVARVMGGDKINLAFTSPPYAEQRDYDQSSGFKPIPPSEYVGWFALVSGNVKTHLANDGSWFINIKPAAKELDTELYVFDLVLAHARQWGWHFVTEFCWERNGIPKQVVRRFKNQFEPIYQFAVGNFKIRPDAVRHKSDNVPKARGKGAGNTSWARHQGGESIFMSGMQGTPGFEWFGDNVGAGMAYPGNRLPTFASTHEATGHAAAFPVGLPQWFVQAYTDTSDIVYDPFMGSGSTLLAAENTNRKARGCELSPLYFATILERWSTHTGKTPVLVDI
jgi:site-specific DNA-methyltransferase (adenine-specific)